MIIIELNGAAGNPIMFEDHVVVISTSAVSRVSKTFYIVNGNVLLS